MTALRIAAENVRMHENNFPKGRTACSLRCNGVLQCAITDITFGQVLTSELWSPPFEMSDLQSSLSQVNMCDYEGGRVDFEVM